MDNNYKHQLLETGLFKRASGKDQYKMRDCYYCGDNKNHFYVRIDVNSNDPVVFTCFKCNLGKGLHTLNKKFLEFHDLESIKIPRITSKKIYSSKPSDMPQLQVTLTEHTKIVSDYIEQRVGVRPTLNDLQMFQFIDNPTEYAKENLGGDLSMLRDRIWFRLTNGNIKGRQLHDNGMRWINYHAEQDRQKGLYTIKRPFDNRKEVNVVIAEGILDVIGLYYNYPLDNAIFLSVLGPNYIAGLEHLISIGIFGDMINIKFFKDKGIKNIRVDKFLQQLFLRIETYQNIAAKDYGVPKSQLEIEKII